MTSGGPRFHPAEGQPDPVRIGRLETWASRHDEWSHGLAKALQEEIDSQCDRLTRVSRSSRNRDAAIEAVLGKRVGALESSMTRVLVSIGAHRVRWGIVWFLLTTAAAALIGKWVG